MDTTLTRPVISQSRIALRCALAGLIPPASLVVAFIAALGLGALVPHMNEGVGAAVVTLLVLAALAAGGGLWARVLAIIAGAPNIHRLTIAGALSQAIMTVLAIIVLGRLEVEFVERGRTALPIHVVFTLLFVPATFIGAFVVGGALGLAMKTWRLAMRMAFFGGLAAALTFLALNVLQDLLGKRVGGPNAAATATMITVTLVGMLGASMALSAMLGRLLAQEFHALAEGPR